MLNLLFLMVFWCYLSTSSTMDPSVFNVYRAESTSSKWATHLQNSNAADEAGVLSYLHSEIIPEDQGSGQGHGCVRKYDKDVIMKFEITVLNPPNLPTPPNGGFMAYDQGVCTAPNCAAKYDLEGYYVGQQFETGNPRYKYKGGNWYSFPEEGMCLHPDGTHNCTFIARLVGQLKIDDLVNSQGEIITPDYHTWCQEDPSHIEMKRIRITPDQDYKCGAFTERCISFWKGICDETACADRVKQLKSQQNLFNTVLANGCDSAKGGKIYLNGSSCVRSCPDNTYIDWNYVCRPCEQDFHCQQCNWAMKPDGSGGDCKSCGETYPYFFIEAEKTRCVSTCPEHYYVSDRTTCQQCSSSCGNCTGPTDHECTSCQIDSKPYLDNGTCVASCKPGEYADEDTKICYLCSPYCEICKSRTQCSNCTNSTFLYDEKCFIQCPSGTKPNGNNCTKSSISTILIIILSAGGGLCVLIILPIVLYLCLKRKSEDNKYNHIRKYSANQ